MAPKGAMKRPAAADGPAKRPRPAASEFVEEKCETIASELREAASLSPGVRALLSDLVPASLGVVKDERHNYQQQGVDMIEKSLESVVDTVKQAIEETKVFVDGAADEKRSRLAAKKEAEAHLSELSAAIHPAMDTLDESKDELKAAKAALAEAKAAQEKGDAELAAAAAGRAELEDARKEAFEPVREAGLASKAVVKTLVDIGKKYKFDPSLVTSMASALTKEPSSRGDFDTVIFEKMTEEFTNHIGRLTTLLDDGEAGKATRASTVASAEEALTAAEQKRDSCKLALAEAVAAEKAAKESYKDAEKSVKNFLPDMKVKMDAYDDARHRLAALQTGALAAFEYLKNLEPPPPPPPVDETEAAVIEPAEAVEGEVTMETGEVVAEALATAQMTEG